MKLRIVNGDGPAQTVDAEITCDHPASRQSVPVLVVCGEPVAVVAAAESGYHVVRATDEERRALLDGGYSLPDDLDAANAANSS